jgi:hypothetical protein
MIKRFRILAAVLLSVAGCRTVGQDFTRPAPESLVLGQTTRNDVIARYGNPYQQNAQVVSDPVINASEAAAPTLFTPAPETGSFASLSYVYADNSTAVWVGGIINEKVLALLFWNEKLIFYNFSSNFSADSSNFDESRVTTLEKGKTTSAEVVQMFGQPTGRAVYPALWTMGDEKFIYQYSEADTRKQQRTIKRLEVLFDPKGTVREYRFLSDGRPLPPPAPATNTFVPVIIPKK